MAALLLRSSPVASARRGLCSSSRLAGLLKAARAGESVVWMAPCAPDFKSEAAACTQSRFVFHNQVDPSFFAGSDVPDRATAIVVSAQTVSKPFLEAWRAKCPPEQEPSLTLVRRGTSLGSIDLAAAKELGIDVVNTPGVNSPHVAKFVVETLGLSDSDKAKKAVVVGTGSVGQVVIQLMKDVGVTPTVVNRSPESPSLASALEGASYVAVCAATSSEPIITADHVKALLGGEQRSIQICSVSRPEAFSLEAIMLIAQRPGQVHLRFDYGDSVLAPTRDKVNEDGVKENVTWSSDAMSSVACKQDMDVAVLQLLTA